MNSLQEKFGRRIKEIRRSQSLTQEMLAENIGIDIPNLSNIETGKKFVSSGTLAKLAKALNVQEKDLFDFEHLIDRELLKKKIIESLNNMSNSDLEFIFKNIMWIKELQRK